MVTVSMDDTKTAANASKPAAVSDVRASEQSKRQRSGATPTAKLRR
jgi:hypothetical protein